MHDIITDGIELTDGQIATIETAENPVHALCEQGTWPWKSSNFLVTFLRSRINTIDFFNKIYRLLPEYVSEEMLDNNGASAALLVIRPDKIRYATLGVCRLYIYAYNPVKNEGHLLRLGNSHTLKNRHEYRRLLHLGAEIRENRIFNEKNKSTFLTGCFGHNALDRVLERTPITGAFNPFEPENPEYEIGKDNQLVALIENNSNHGDTPDDLREKMLHKKLFPESVAYPDLRSRMFRSDRVVRVSNDFARGIFKARKEALLDRCYDSTKTLIGQWLQREPNIYDRMRAHPRDIQKYDTYRRLESPRAALATNLSLIPDKNGISYALMVAEGHGEHGDQVANAVVEISKELIGEFTPA